MGKREVVYSNVPAVDARPMRGFHSLQERVRFVGSFDAVEMAQILDERRVELLGNYCYMFVSESWCLNPDEEGLWELYCYDDSGD